MILQRRAFSMLIAIFTILLLSLIASHISIMLVAVLQKAVVSNIKESKL